MPPRPGAVGHGPRTSRTYRPTNGPHWSQPTCHSCGGSSTPPRSTSSWSTAQASSRGCTSRPRRPVRLRSSWTYPRGPGRLKVHRAWWTDGCTWAGTCPSAGAFPDQRQQLATWVAEQSPTGPHRHLPLPARRTPARVHPGRNHRPASDSRRCCPIGQPLSGEHHRRRQLLRRSCPRDGDHPGASFVLNADTKRAAVLDFLAVQDGALGFGVVANQRGTVNRVVFRPDGQPTPGWYAYTPIDRRPGGTAVNDRPRCGSSSSPIRRRHKPRRPDGKRGRPSAARCPGTASRVPMRASSWSPTGTTSPARAARSRLARRVLGRMGGTLDLRRLRPRRRDRRARPPEVLAHAVPPSAAPTEPRRNTDPLVFGTDFIYSNCKQSPPMRALAEGSLVLFGSGTTSTVAEVSFSTPAWSWGAANPDWSPRKTPAGTALTLSTTPCSAPWPANTGHAKPSRSRTPCTAATAGRPPHQPSARSVPYRRPLRTIPPTRPRPRCPRAGSTPACSRESKAAPASPPQRKSGRYGRLSGTRC